jgi:hypothetical protein
VPVEQRACPHSTSSSSIGLRCDQRRNAQLHASCRLELPAVKQYMHGSAIMLMQRRLAPAMLTSLNFVAACSTPAATNERLYRVAGSSAGMELPSRLHIAGARWHAFQHEQDLRRPPQPRPCVSSHFPLAVVHAHVYMQIVDTIMLMTHAALCLLQWCSFFQSRGALESGNSRHSLVVLGWLPATEGISTRRCLQAGDHRLSGQRSAGP